MTIAALLPFLMFAIVASATPGPNNIMVLAAAATRGLKRTIPLVLGVTIGFGFMVAVVGVGLAAPLARFPHLHDAMRWIGAVWMLVLAWKIGRTPGMVLPGREAFAPLGFWGACAFQWINPKAWVLAVATAATYGVRGVDPFLQSLVLALVFILVSLPSVSGWALLGLGVGRFLATPRRMRIFNVIMGVLLAASVVPAVIDRSVPEMRREAMPLHELAR